jgi:hypothetical protein
VAIDRSDEMAGRCFVTTYHPLVKTRAGQQAVRRHGLLAFVDGSCRREPDFESRFPSITAICRGGNFAPRLRDGDRIAYLTIKGKYLGARESGWHLVAVLRVIHRFDSHNDAAAWYRQENQLLPNNCFVDGNPPNPYEFTDGDLPKKVKSRIKGNNDFNLAVRLWDWTYHKRVAKWPVFLVTEPEFLELNHPPQLREVQMREIFAGKIPGTRNPPEITCEQLERLLQLAARCAV